MFQADTNASCRLLLVSTIRHPYCSILPIPQNLCDSVMHTFYADAKVYTDTC